MDDNYNLVSMHGSPETIRQISEARELLCAGKTFEAAELLDIILIIAPDNPDARDLYADIALQQRDHAKAIELLGPLLSSQPNNALLHGKIGVIHAMQGEFHNAVKHLRKSIQLKPEHLPAHIDLCNVARELNQLDEAIHAGCTAIRLNPNIPKAHSSLALAYELYGQHRKAQEHYTKAATLAPDDANAQYKCGIGHLIAGANDTARQHLEHAITIQPGFAPPYQALARLKRYTSSDHDDFVRLHRLLDNTDTPEEDRCYFHFALAKMYEDCELYDRAFQHYDAGNRIENRKHNFDPSEYQDYIRRLIETCSADLISGASALSNPDSRPVFLVGMPRSGTTLVEHILACHPEVHGAGELSWLDMAEHALPSFMKSSKTYPECMTELDSSQIRILSRKYIDYLETLSEHEKFSRIIDKMPDNYERIGLISLLFPNARIIHCMRDPLDNSISQFSLLFPGTLDYSYDLFNLGAHYAEYQRLMDHWKSVRPEQIFDIHYENMVQNQEFWTRKLLEFLDLPWHPGCLRFYESERNVRTASHSQVRTPIYSSSVGRWKKYEKYLEPLQRGLRWPEDTRS